MTYDNEFLEGLVKSGTMILISEIGDKTFFIAAIMAMRHSRLTVRPVPPIPAEFTRLPLGLSADRPRFRSPVPIDSTGLHWRHRSARRDDRTIRGDGMGRAQPGESHSTFTPQRTFIHQSNDAIRKTSSSRTHTRVVSLPLSIPPLNHPQISKEITHYLAVGLFFFFGLRSLYESIFAWDGGGDELAETEAELADADKKKKSTKKKKKGALLSPVLVETFIITFLAEWGDRSQIATIGLAASSDPVGVTIGGVVGHAVCTGAAVIGGRHMAEHISERAVAIAGGVLFCLFGAHSLVTGMEQ